MTRGTARSLDYRFLIETPPEIWWKPSEEWVLLEDPQIIVCGSGNSARLLASAIPSARRDVVTTAIRYTLVAEGIRDPALLGQLVTALLRPDGAVRLGKALDDAFSAAEIDGILSGRDSSTPAGSVSDRAEKALLSLSGDAAYQPPPGTQSGGSWVSSLGDGTGRDAFVARAAALTGQTGWAFTTTALSSRQGAERAAAKLGDPVAVLLVEGDVQGCVPLGKAMPAPSRRDRRPALPLAAIVILGIGAAAAIWLVIDLIRHLRN